MSPPNIPVKISHPLYLTLLYIGHAIRNCHQHKDLGILMSCDLSWSSHISSITTQAYKKLGLLHQSLHVFWWQCINKENALPIYHLYDRSQLVYCLQVWCLSLVKEMKSIEDVQRLATKFILNDYVSDYRTRQL